MKNAVDPSGTGRSETWCLHAEVFLLIGIIISRFQVETMSIHNKALACKHHVFGSPFQKGLRTTDVKKTRGEGEKKTNKRTEEIDTA